MKLEMLRLFVLEILPNNTLISLHNPRYKYSLKEYLSDSMWTISILFFILVHISFMLLI